MMASSNSLGTTKPLISIIVPSFNAGANITNCLRSICTQTFFAYEAIIVDGNSKDDTESHVKEIQKHHENIFFYSEKDKGPYDAMNKGIGLAKGDWLIFLGADDELNDTSVIADIAKVLSNQEAYLVYGDVLLIGDTLFGKDNTQYDGEFDKAKLIKKNICHQSIFYRKSVFEQIGNYNLAYSVCADWDLNLRCFAKLETLHIPRVIAKFSAGGLSSREPDLFYIRDRALNAKRYFDISYFNRWFKDEAKLFFRCAKYEFMCHNYLKALLFMSIAVYHGPAESVKYAVGKITGR